MTFNSMVHGVRKVNNHPASFADKVDLRNRVLDAVGGRVFDCYAGAGEMYRAVWQRAVGGYVGCDVVYYPDEREAYVADCRRVLRQVDLRPFSIFDIDCYGSPWETCLIIAARRPVKPGERIGLVLTEGSGMKIKFGVLPKAMAQIAGMKERAPGAIRGQKEIAGRAIRSMAARMNCTIEKTWRAERQQGSAMLYYGVVLVGS